MQPVIRDDLRLSIQPWVNKGGNVVGAEIRLVCPECGRNFAERYSLSEMVTILKGGAVQGVSRDNRGWVRAVRCPNEDCTLKGFHTTVTYRIGVQDFLPIIQNVQGHV